jgi:hypothetical protein
MRKPKTLSHSDTPHTVISRHGWDRHWPRHLVEDRYASKPVVVLREPYCLLLALPINPEVAKLLVLHAGWYDAPTSTGSQH